MIDIINGGDPSSKLETPPFLANEAWEALPETWPQEGVEGVAQEDEERPKTRVLVSTLQNSTRLLLVCWMMRAGIGVVGEVTFSSIPPKGWGPKKNG